MLSAVVIAALAGGPAPEQVHLAPGPTPASMVVSWATPAAAGAAFARFGSAGGALSTEVAGSTTVFTEYNPKGCQYHHKATLTPLEAGAAYSYQVGNRNGSTSAVFNTTAFRSEKTWSPNVLYYGDLGHHGGKIVHEYFTVLPAVEKEVAGGGVDAVVHAGDFAYNLEDNGGELGDQFMRRIQPVASRVPYITCPGNHEIMSNNSFAHYRNRFHMPHSDEMGGFRMWFSLDMGLMHLVSFSTEAFFARPESEQKAMLDWLAADLQAANKNRENVPWIVAFAHRPMYCSNADGDCINKGSSGERVRSTLEKMLYDSGVDMLLWAHEHSYERMWPVYNMTVTQKNYVNPKAPVHIVSGAAGCAESDGLCLNPILAKKGDWSAFRSGELFHPYTYGHVRPINSTHLFWDQINGVTGRTIDSIYIVQSSHGPFA